MTSFPGPESPGDGVIRITPADVASAHVDDMLKRHASLRGEQGVTASRKRRWFYRNWFVLMLAGMLGAVAAWALIEPHFDDLLYVQGKIERIDKDGFPKSRIDIGGLGSLELFAGNRAEARLRVNGESIYLLSFTKQLNSAEKPVVQPRDLNPGQEVGLYLQRPDRDSAGGEEFGLAVFVDTAPPPRATPTPPLARLAAAQTAVALLLFPAVAAAIGLTIGAADGIICRLWRRVLVAGVVGLLIGFLGGFVSQILAGLVYMPLNRLAMEQQTGGFGHLTTVGFLTQVTGRGLAWCLAGMAMGLGQGIALRSWRLLLYGFLGGAIGGLLGGLLFDPIDLLLLGVEKPSAHLSRLVGLLVIGAGVGVMIGVVELLARDAWLHMLEGPLAGKEFLLFKDLLHVGASPRSDIYLFNDPDVAGRHAVIRAAADHYEIEVVDPHHPVLLNERPVQRARLRHGDRITLGRTVFAFHRRRTD